MIGQKFSVMENTKRTPKKSSEESLYLLWMLKSAVSAYTYIYALLKMEFHS